MNTTLLDAALGKKTKYTPVWYMRQAGRFLPEYQKLKGDKNILDIIQTPELAAQIALSPVKVLGVDGAVLYADIMTPLVGIGVELEIIESVGPVIRKPFSSINDIKRIRSLEPQEDIPYLLETISILKKELEVPLIGFSAAPFTLASYLIEGKPSRDFLKTKLFMYTQREAWDALMESLSELIVVYLLAQIKQGVDIVQLFDSWVGCLSELDYIEYVLPFTKRIFEEISKTKTPSIHFGTNIAAFLLAFASVDCNVISVDWRMPLAKAWQEIGPDKGIQGNLDPALLLGDFSLVKTRVDEIFAALPKREGYIFNLGHGVLPGTPVENMIKLTEYVHSK